ncbi:RDD family protein [Clostridium acetireducens DSM 10703]|jgi:uncharacterized RDD family membrane protein YckC|uniref:RDD family protein n=1 Tax=Clostridium acetireducens DSM 10703 TaxID=1121290 RepID=A0A1E8EZ95_9CLOT|nr:RDD family protein [Clostridium acetireducens]OFI06301.1 RDD family protein [Clostridium acetireducens DSM 10703]
MADEKAKKDKEVIEVTNNIEENPANNEEIIPIKKASPIKVFFANFIDGLIMYAISLVGVSALDFIMRATIGYYIKNKSSMTTMIFLIVAIIYPTIMEVSKKGCTVGQKQYDFKLFKIK